MNERRPSAVDYSAELTLHDVGWSIDAVTAATTAYSDQSPTAGDVRVDILEILHGDTVGRHRRTSHPRTNPVVLYRHTQTHTSTGA